MTLEVLASLLLAGVVLATIGATGVGLGIVAGGGLIFGLVVPLGGDDDGGHRIRLGSRPSPSQHPLRSH